MVALFTEMVQAEVCKEETTYYATESQRQETKPWRFSGFFEKMRDSHQNHKNQWECTGNTGKNP